MPYMIAGLPKAQFAPLFEMTDVELEAQGAQRRISDGVGFPCRVGLEDVPAGRSVVLLNYVSHDVAGPFRTAYAIYVGEDADEPKPYVGRVPAHLDRRLLSLRGFGEDGMLKTAMLCQPGEADSGLRDLLARDEVTSVHAHNAITGCFLAKAVKA